MGRYKSRHGTGGRPARGMGRSIRRDAVEGGERTPRSGPPPEAIHLRQMRADAAMEKLRTMVELHRRRGTLELLVVHGKGLHSEGGRPVIAPLVRDWLKAHPETAAGWRPAHRERTVSAALRIFAQFAQSADKGAARLVP